MIRPACHRRFLHALGVTTQRDRCSIAAMMELIFFVFVLLGIVLIDSRLHRLVKIQRDALTELRECETHLQVMCEAYKAQSQ